MNINPTSYSTVNDYPLQVQQAMEMKGISTTMSQINEAHEERKKEIDEINQQSYS
jgi:hypothetical protein